jgi:hypothetical protein
VQQLTRLAHLPLHKVGFGRRVEMSAKELQDMRPAAAADRRESIHCWTLGKAAINIDQ